MKRIIIISLSSILLVLSALLTISYIKVKDEKILNELIVNINSYLKEEEYEKAFALVNEENDKYVELLNVEIDKYITKLCNESKDNLIVEKLIKFSSGGGSYQVIEDTIKEIESKLLELKISSENFDYAVLQYSNRNFEEARQYFETVVEDDENYIIATSYLDELIQRDISWNNNVSGKSSFLNACTYHSDYLYIPFILDGVDGIYKLTKDGQALDFFPLSNQAGKLVISSINVVGDYIYFIAGENVGSGYTFKSPYCIYEMRTDGTDLTLVSEGNYIDMHIKGDSIYAISRSLGLIEYDRNFKVKNIISTGIVTEMSVCTEGVYYTLQDDFTFDNDSSVYFYNGSESILIDTKEYLHYFQFNDMYLKLWQKNSVFDMLNYGNDNSEVRIRNADIYKVYGMIAGKVLYSCTGSLGREILYTYNIDNGTTTQLIESKDILDYNIKGICYEEDKLIIEKDGFLFFSDIEGENRVAINNIEVDSECLYSNEEIIKHLNYSDIYIESSDEKIISAIYDIQNWHYKDDKLNITIEKRYLDYYDCNVYVTHIFTTDYSMLTTGNAKTDSLTSSKTYKASSISDMYQAIYAQNTDTFTYKVNFDQGIIIRKGQVVRDVFIEDMIALFNDGSMEVYRSGDPINSNELLEKGASTSFSFGPILVEDYNVLNDCLNVKLADRNPRSAIGYIEPGHYVMIACDGRDPEVSRGLNMIQLARIFEEEGCELAYNLDGGMTTTILFMGNYVTNRPSYSSGSEWFFYRSIAEVFYVGTSELSPVDLDVYTCDYDYFKEKFVN